MINNNSSKHVRCKEFMKALLWEHVKYLERMSSYSWAQYKRK